MFGFVHFAELDSAAAHPPEQEMLLPSSQSAGEKKDAVLTFVNILCIRCLSNLYVLYPQSSGDIN